MNPAGLAGTDGKIKTLASHESMVYVGGKFTIAGTVFAHNVAQWDGKEWRALGEGIEGEVHTLCCDSKGTLYAAASVAKQGKLQIPHPNNRLNAASAQLTILKWDGQDWEKIGTVNGSGNQAGSIRSMMCDTEDRLYISGYFGYVDKCKARNIARYEEEIWHPIGDGKGFPIGDNSYSGDPIYNLVNGEKGNIYAVNRNCVGRWDGTAWSHIGEALEGSLAGIVFDKKNGLAAGGEFRLGNKKLPLAFYKENIWEYPEIQFSSRLNALALDSGGILHIASTSTVYARQSNELIPLGGLEYEDRLQGNVLALTFDNQNNIYAAGYGISIGGKQPSVSILKWDGTKWQRLLSQTKEVVPAPPTRNLLSGELPLPDSLSSSQVKSSVVTTNGDVYVSGQFKIFAGRECLVNLAHWDGRGWHAVGSGLSAPATVLAADIFGNLYAAGRFPTPGGYEHNSLMHWNGMAWQPIKDAPRDITTMLCDASGYLYIGTAASPKGYWDRSISRWDDSTLITIEGAPSGSYPNFAEHGRISQLDVIGNELHVQGDFTMVGNVISPGYAVYDLGKPDSGRIKARQETMQLAASQSDKETATVLLKEAYLNLGEEQVIRFEKMEVSNQTSQVLDSVILYTPDSSGFIYDNTEEKWGHITQRPVIDSGPQGYRFSFPLGHSLLPAQKRPLWISKSLKGRVKPIEPDAWICKDTLQTIFTNVAIETDSDNQRSLYRLFVVQYDSFTVLNSHSDEDNRYTTISGIPGAPFEIRFAKKAEYDSVCAVIIDYVNNYSLINEYTPPSRDLLFRLEELSRVKQELLAQRLLEWCFSFENPLLEYDLWELIGEDPEGYLPEPEELKRRFSEISHYYLDALTVVVPSLSKNSYEMVAEMVAEKIEIWPFSDYHSVDNSITHFQFEGDLFYYSEETEGDELKVGFYPRELIRNTLKLLGTRAKPALDEFERHVFGE